MISLLLYIFFFLQSPSFFAETEYLVQNFTVEDGLPVNSVTQIVQDDDGYLWFATLDGLVRYDGYEFKTFNSGNTEGIYSNRIAGMLRADANEIWMIHAEGIITRKTENGFTTFAESLGNLHAAAMRMIESKDGHIWISTESGIAVFNNNNGKFEPVNPPLLNTVTWAIESMNNGGIAILNENGLVQWKDNEASVLIPSESLPIEGLGVIQIKQFKKNELWVMGDEGLFLYSLPEQRIEFIYRPGWEAFTILNLHPEPDGTFIINSNNGFYSLDPASENVEKLQPDFTTTRTERINLIFRGAENEKIRIGDGNLWIDDRLVMQTDEIQSAMLDSEGSLWIATRLNGVFHIRKSDFTNITAQQFPGFENIYPVIQASDGAIWAGSFVSGIHRISGTSITNWNASNSSLTGNLCRFLFEDPDGSIYAGMWGEGLWIYEPLSSDWEKVAQINELTNPYITVEAMHKDRNGRLFVGTTEELLVSDGDTFARFEESEDSRYREVRVIREGHNGALFMGTNGNGLTIVEGNKSVNYTSSNSPVTSDFIRDIYVQSPDTLWLATENLGLNRAVLDDELNLASLVSINENDGLIKNSLHRIIESPDRHLWISSNSGIMRISKKDLNQYADGTLNDLPVLQFDENDGMISREANGGVQTAGMLSNDQILWFPNQKGLTLIDPLQFTNNLPQPIIQEIEFSDTTLIAAKRPAVEIPGNERNLRIKFTAPNFSAPKHIQFRYKLEGVNPDWEDANLSREAVLTNIPPGTHEFQLMVYRTGSPAVTEASLTISIPYFFYETTWFYGLMGLAVFFLIFGGIKYRTRILEERERKLQERVDQQTVALKEAAEQKSRFFSGITHELKTPLSLIVSPLEDILEKQERIPDPSTRNRLHLMHRSGRQLKNLVDQILDVTKLNSDAIKLTLKPVNLPELTRQIIGQFQSKLEQEEIELVFESDPLDEYIYVDTGAWERIVINLLSNAIRFSPQGSTVYVNVQNRGDQVAVQVKDQGIGIEEKDAEKIFEYLYQAESANAAEGTGIGLYLVKGLVEHMGGSIGLSSNTGEGAEFTVALKKGHSHFRDSDSVIHEPLTGEISKVKKAGQNTRLSLYEEKDLTVETVLVVEDNYDYRNYLASVLSEHYNVITASEGNEAFRILRGKEANLVISDVMMPGMNGLEFVGNLRKQEEYRHLPVIFLSAKNQELDVETGLSTGADIYLTKPIKSSLLLSQIKAVLRRERVLKEEQDESGKTGEDPFLKKIRTNIYRQLANPALNIDMLAETLFMSRTKLYNKWKKVSKISLNDFIKQIRLNEAKVLLTEQRFSVREAATAVGYADANYFSTSFKKEFGVNPSEM